MAIDYRYHIGSFVAVFMALLLGILIGIGLAPSPEELNREVSELKRQYDLTRQYRDAELDALKEESQRTDAVARDLAAAVISGRLAGQRVALVLAPGLDRELAGTLRATLSQAGASVSSTMTITRNFVAMPEALREKVCKQLLLYLPADTPIRPVLARFIAGELSQGRAKLIPALHSSGLVETTSGSLFDTRVDAVVLVGGMSAQDDVRPEQIDLPLIEELGKLGVRVVACEESKAKFSCIPAYRGQDIATVDNVDTLAGRLALVLALQGATGHFGLKETADRLLPPIANTYK